VTRAIPPAAAVPDNAMAGRVQNTPAEADVPDAANVNATSDSAVLSAASGSIHQPKAATIADPEVCQRRTCTKSECRATTYCTTIATAKGIADRKPMVLALSSATLSYTRSVYTDWCSTNTFSLYGRQSPGRLNCFLIPGNVLENVPPWSGSANFNYTHELVGEWNWLLRGTFQYQDGQYESDMNLLKSMPGYIFNFNAGIERESLTVEVYCSNCTDETAYHRIVRCCADPRFGPNAGTNGTFTGTMRKPRTVGFRATYTM